jgi:hypothetical protein
MSLVVDATVGGVNANSYITVEEAAGYWESRPFPEMWANSTQPAEAMVITATSMIDALFTPTRKLIRSANGKDSYYILRPVWLGSPATTTQALAWPRTGMHNQNGGDIPSDVIPQGLKTAVAELAGQLSKSDRFLDNSTLVQGISSLRAGSVSLTFKNAAEFEIIKILPDIIYEFLSAWITDELYEPVGGLIFEVTR